MGEFAIYRNEEIKIGTNENLFYLRADQWSHVTPLLGDCDEATYLKESRFRFPWPDEDCIEPGTFSDHERSYPLRGIEPPTSLKDEHGLVQFRANGGYLCSLACPESGVKLDGVNIQHNSYPGTVNLCQQRWWDGLLVGVLRCNGCGLLWRLETLWEAEPVAVALRAEADRLGEDGRALWLHTVADRLLAGYAIEGPGVRGGPAGGDPE